MKPTQEYFSDGKNLSKDNKKLKIVKLNCNGVERKFFHFTDNIIIC